MRCNYAIFLRGNYGKYKCPYKKRKEKEKTSLNPNISARPRVHISERKQVYVPNERLVNRDSTPGGICFFFRLLEKTKKNFVRNKTKTLSFVNRKYANGCIYFLYMFLSLLLLHENESNDRCSE